MFNGKIEASTPISREHTQLGGSRLSGSSHLTTLVGAPQVRSAAADRAGKWAVKRTTTWELASARKTRDYSPMQPIVKLFFVVLTRFDAPAVAAGGR